MSYQDILDRRNQRFFFAVAAVGTARDINCDFQVATIEIDNPTGLWLYLQPVAMMIPPYTIGWRTEIRPTASQIIITYVTEPPGGQASTATGDQIVVTCYSAYMGLQNGLDYSLNQNIIDLSAEIASLRAAINALAGGYGQDYDLQIENASVTDADGLTTIIAAPGPGNRLVIVSATVYLDVQTAGYPRGYWTPQIRFAGGGLIGGTISSEEPTVHLNIPPGFKGPNDTALGAIAQAQQDPQAFLPYQTAYPLEFDVVYYITTI